MAISYADLKKFNDRHDPKTGRFAPKSGGALSGELKVAYDKEKVTYEMLGLDTAPLDDKYELLSVLNHGTTVNIGAMNDDVRRQTVDTVKKVVENYPMVKEAITSVQVGDKYDGYDYFEENPKVLASYNPNSGKLCFNPRFYDKKSSQSKEAEEIYQKSVEKGYHPEGTNFNSVVAHELGHAIDIYYNKTSNSPTSYSFDLKREVNYNLRQNDKDFNLFDTETLRKGLSDYATKDDAEFFAEAMAEYICSPSPRKIATAVGKAVDSRVASDKHFNREYKSIYNKEGE